MGYITNYEGIFFGMNIFNWIYEYYNQHYGILYIYTLYLYSQHYGIFLMGYLTCEDIY